MSAEPGNRRNRISTKKVTVYALFTALCIVLGYLESLLELNFIAPGVKLGLSNSAALILASRGDLKGAWLVNIARILLSALLFGSPVSLVFSLCAGVASLIALSFFIRIKSLSLIGTGIISGAVHNSVQCAVAVFFVSSGILFYLPILILCGGVCGAFIGLLSQIISKKMKTNTRF